MPNHRISIRVQALLAEVIALGGCLHVTTWRELTLRHGYRYCNGFFGGRVPSMVSDGDMRIITDAGRARAM